MRIPDKPSLTRRVLAGEVAGFVLGIVIAVILPVAEPELGIAYKIGIVLYHTVTGALIGFAGFYTVHPILGMPLPWMARGPLLGAFMSLTGVLLNMPAALSGAGGLINIWTPIPVTIIAVIAGAVFGFVVEWLATQYGGEGQATGHERETERPTP